MRYYCYCLFRKGEARPFYFGASCDLLTRKDRHIRFYGPGTYFCLLDTCFVYGEANDLETKYIELFAACDWPLENQAKNPAFTGKSFHYFPELNP